MIQTCRKGWPYLVGGPYTFEQRPLFGLQVGEAISAIGQRAASGKETSSCRHSTFSPPAIFSGFYTGPGGTEGTTYAAFLLGGHPQPIWEVWAVSEAGQELFLQNFRTRSISIHKAHFTK